MSAEVVFENKEIIDFLENLGKRLKNIKDGERRYAGLLSTIIYKDVMSHFDKQEGSDGKWDHWSYYYTVKMEKSGKGGNKILQDTGRLRQSFLPTNNRSSNEGITWFNSAITKQGFPYAWAHNEGDGNLPKRDFMWASDKAMESMTEKTLQFMIDEGV